ncbi:hypothetical protein ABEB36_004009 [Hypothenemus hampei]|uniref:Uncharacterized protein n=1 Tax=Hypothenemus hampei TaxID=57062 RepID=A0ABD1F1W3_HYPHA
MAEEAAGYIEDVQDTRSTEEVDPNLPGPSITTTKKNTQGKLIHSGAFLAAFFRYSSARWRPSYSYNHLLDLWIGRTRSRKIALFSIRIREI